MGKIQFTNHFNATLASAVNASDTILTLDLTDTVSPTIVTDGRVPLTMLDSTNPAAFEVVYLTNITGTQFTVLRGMEGTTAQSWSSGCSVIAPPTAGSQQLLTQAGYAPPWSSTVADLIGGYQKYAVVNDSNGVAWQSQFDNNFVQPGSDNTSWVRYLGGQAPVGSIMDFAGSTPPAGWLLCTGAAVSRSTYSALFNVLGATWGGGDGSTTFNLPDLRGRLTAGQDNMGGNAAGRITQAGSGVNATQLGSTGGSEQLQAHSHSVSDPGHSHGISDPGHSHGVYDPGHSHTFPRNYATSAYGNGPWASGGDNEVDSSNALNASSTGISINASGTGVSVQSAGTRISVNQTGAGQSANMPPVAILSKIIYAGA